MKLVQIRGDWAVVELEKGERYKGFMGAHVDTEIYAVDRILSSCLTGGAKNWSWAPLMYYTWDRTFAVITKHDYETLTQAQENEWGIVSP